MLKICWRRDGPPTPIFLGFPGGSASKESTCNAGPGFDPWVGNIPWRRERLPTLVFWPGRSLDCIIHGVAESWTWLSDFHTVKGFSIVKEAEVDVFLEFSCFLNDPMDVGYLFSGTSAFSNSRLYIWKFLVHLLLKPSLKDFEHYLAGM